MITIAAGASPVTEGTAATFTVTANPAPAADLTVNLTVADDSPWGSFVAAADTGSQTVTIPMGMTSATHSVPTSGDTREDRNGPVTVTVKAGTGYTVGSASSASVTVEDDEPTIITLSAPDDDAYEGGDTTSADRATILLQFRRDLFAGESLTIPLSFAGGALGADFTLALDQTSTGVTLSDSTVSIVGVDAGAPSGGDFFFPGIRVHLLALADMNTANEQVTVSFGSVTGTVLGGGFELETFGGLVIDLLDVTPTLSIAAAAASVTEGSPAEFLINIAQITGRETFPISVSLTVADASGSSDFVAAANEGDKTTSMSSSHTHRYSVPTVGDIADEPNGQVTVTLKRTSAYEVHGSGVASVLVRDDDGPAKPEVTIAAGTSPVTEGTAAAFTVSASPAPSADLTVDLTVSDAPGADFVAAGDESSQTATISMGMTSATYSVATAGDSADELSGPVTVAVASSSAYDRGTARSASVQVNDDDDTTVTLTTPDATATEGDASATASLTVTLSRGLVSGEKLVVPLAFAGGAPGVDFTLSLSGAAPAGVTFSGSTLAFTGPATGSTATAATLLLTASDDADQISETVTASLGALTATGLDGAATGSRTGDGEITIADDDVTHVLSVRVSATADEGDAGRSYREVFFDVTPARSAQFYFKACLSGDAQRYLSTADQQAGLKHDYDMYDITGAIHNSVGVGPPVASYPEGCTTVHTAFASNKRYFVGVSGDAEVETDETVTITALRETSASKATPSDVAISSTAGSATYTIRNDDVEAPDVTIAAAASSVAEGTAAAFTVSASPAPTTSLDVDLTVSDAPGADFVASSGEGAQTVTIAANATSATYSAATAGDNADEPSGPVTVAVAAGAGYDVGSPSSASVTVEDDDATTATLSGAAGDLVEGASKDVILTLGRGLVQGETLTAPLTFGGTATRGADYSLACPSPAPTGVACANLNGGSATVSFTGPSSGATATEVAVALTATEDNAAESTAETVVVGLGTLTHTGLDGGASGADNLADFAIADPPPANSDGSYTVPAAWALKPSAVAASGKFRLLFITSSKRDAQSSSVADYDSHAQAAADAGHAALRPYRNAVSAVVSTAAADARDNTGTTGTGVPIYWLNGDVVADDYADFYDGTWDNREPSDTRNERGAVEVANVNPDGRTWTGSSNDGTKSSGSHPLGAGSHSTIGDIYAGATTGPLNAGLVVVNSTSYKLYALSPVFAVEGAPATPVANFAASSSNPSEDAGAHNVAVTISPAPVSGVTLSYAVGGTATSGADYAALSGSLSVAAGATSANIPVSIVDDSVDDDDETVELTLAAGSGYALGSTSAHTVTIQDNDAAAGVTTSREIVVMKEGAPAETYTVELTKAPTANVTVTGTVRDPTTLAVHKAGGAPGSSFTLTFTPTDWNQPQTVTMTPLEDSNADNDVTRITHSATGTGEYASVPDWVVIVTVEDNDDAPAVAAGVTTSREIVVLDEGAAPETYTAELTKAPTANVTVTGTVRDPTTLAVHKAGGAPGSSFTLTFTPTDWNQPQTVTMTPLEDANADNDVTRITHSATGTGEYASVPDRVVIVTVDDNDETPSAPPAPPTPPTPPSSTPTVALSASPNPAIEGEAIAVTATLSESLRSDVTIPLVWTAGTAEPGDYGPLASIAIAAGQPSGAGSVATNADDDADDETLTVALGSLPAGLRAGTPSSVLLTITETGRVGDVVSAESADDVPEAFALEQNYPNPFNPSTTIRFSLDKAQRVRLAVYDLLGQEVRALVDGARPAAHYDVVFDASDLSSGVYLYVLETEKQVAVKTMSLVK